MRALSYHPKAGHDLSQVQLSAFEEVAETQEAVILEYFATRAGKALSCEDLEFLGVLSPGTPHSSYIRALANLRRDGKIARAGKVAGRYGRPINTYSWVKF